MYSYLIVLKYWNLTWEYFLYLSSARIFLFNARLGGLHLSSRTRKVLLLALSTFLQNLTVCSHLAWNGSVFLLICKHLGGSFISRYTVLMRPSLLVFDLNISLHINAELISRLIYLKQSKQCMHSDSLSKRQLILSIHLTGNTNYPLPFDTCI